ADTGSAKVALTEAIKSLSNVSGREAEVGKREFSACKEQVFEDSFWSLPRRTATVPHCFTKLF
ncbi:hypothetical protein, partial [Klebsiella michiganensis]|uniref:hypothetical protein n=1 Tax=Klebsiella michiganensis TaxID=1134687 RepID=UPI00292F0BF0